MSDAYAPDPNVSPAQAHWTQAELADRFLAKLIDFVLVGVVIAIINIVFTVALVFGTGSGFITSVITTLISTALLLGYFTVMESNLGQTVGKMVMKLRVVGPTGASPSIEQALRRNIWMAIWLAGIVPFVGWLIQLVGWIAALVTIALGINNDPTRRQAWHDQLGGGTQVVKQG